jgi:hypothetical protein
VPFALKNYDEILTPFIRPLDVMTEVKEIVRSMFPHFDFAWVMRVYQDITRLFRGDYPGYRKCNTAYHDWRHTEDCLLATVRLIHGAQLDGCRFSKRGVSLGIIAAIMHDTGYIQEVADQEGTGAKYTLIHVERSIDFMETYFADRGHAQKDFHFCRNCLQCTGVNVEIRRIEFESLENEIIGKILGTADLIGQMSDTNYLEKLPILYQEFLEGGITAYASELDFLEKTFDFWKVTRQRFGTELGGVDAYSRAHFRVRWGIDRALDKEAIEWNLARLRDILKHRPPDRHRHPRSPQRILVPEPKRSVAL